MEGNSIKVEDNSLDELYSSLRSRAEVNKTITHVRKRLPNPIPSNTGPKSPTQINSLTDRLFRIPVLVNVYKLGQLFQVKLKPGTTQADQGSDINIISDKLAKDLKTRPIKLGPHIVLTMGTANGESTQFHQYAEIKICVEEI